MVYQFGKLVCLFSACLVFNSCDPNVVLGKTFNPQDYPGDYTNTQDSGRDVVYLRMQSHFYVGYLEINGEKYYIKWVPYPSVQVDFNLYTNECTNTIKPTFWRCTLSKEKGYFRLKVSKDYYFDGSYDGEVYNLYKIAEDQKADFSFRRNCFCEVHWEQSAACSEPKASSDNTSSD